MGYSERQRQTEANLRYEEYRMGLTPKDNWKGNKDGYIKYLIGLSSWALKYFAPTGNKVTLEPLILM